MTAVMPTEGSAADQVWRTIRFDIWPMSHSVRWAVYLRKTRGLDLVWQKNLGAAGIELGPNGTVESLEGILRTVASALLEQADEIERTS